MNVLEAVTECWWVYFSRFRASLYPCPETPQERKEMLAGVNSRIDDLQMVRQCNGPLLALLYKNLDMLYQLMVYNHIK